MNVILLLSLPDAVRSEYARGIQQAFPALTLHALDHVSKVDPYLAEAEVLITFGPHLRDRADHVLGQAQRLRWIQALGTGVDNIADRPALRDHVILTNIHGIHGAAVSEAAVMAMLALAR